MDKVETILYNLLSNAFKFTPPEGSIDITIKTKQAEKEFIKGSVEIIVTDWGIGISGEDQPKIFDRFYQAPQAKNIEAGSGIGLTLVAEYTKLHHGKVSVESSLGRGSRFSISLPLGNLHFPVDNSQEDRQLNLLATKNTHDDRQEIK